MAVIDIVKWDAEGDEVYAWKYPSQELATWTQLVVAESQEAFLVREGQMFGPFGPGRHTLSTKNIPWLRRFVQIPFGGRTPFTAEVWFVNRTIPLDIMWGTADPIQLLDPKYNVMLPIRAYGQYGVRITQSKKFLIKLVGTLTVFDRERLVSYFRGLVLTRAKDIIAKYIVRDAVSILEIAAHLNDISEALKKDMVPELDEFGLELIKFFVNSINTPETDPAVARLKQALARKAEMEIVGYTYQEQRSFDTMETAAGNPGSGGGGNLMGAGIGLGMGLGIGGPMGGAMGRLAKNLQPGGGACPECQTVNPPGARFCSGCGAALIPPQGEKAPKAESEQAEGKKAEEKTPEVVCARCGTKVPEEFKFCPGCGKAMRLCPTCGADNPPESRTCVKCGAPLATTCPKCGAQVSGTAKFCPNCGNLLVEKCAGCGAALAPGAKFCPECGAPVTQGAPPQEPAPQEPPEGKSQNGQTDEPRDESGGKGDDQ